MIARMATYTFTGDAHDLGERAESGILPVLQEQSGFKAYSVAATNDEILSLSVWDTRENAGSRERGSRRLGRREHGRRAHQRRDPFRGGAFQHDARR